MKNSSRTNQELLKEISALKQRIRKLENAEAERIQAEAQLRASECSLQVTNAQMNDALDKSESLMRAITDSVRDAVLMMDSAGCISFWNKAAEYIFGYTSEEAIGRNLHQFLAPRRYLEAYDAAFPKFKKTGRGAAISKTIELQACRKNGEEFPIELSLSAIQLKENWCAVGIIRDITTRKRAVEALRQSEELYRTFINATPDMVFLKDEMLRNIAVNKSLAEFFGKPEDEIIGKSDFELMPQIAAEKCKQTDLEALRGKSIVVSEELIGGEVYETVKFPVNIGQNKTGVGGFIRIITARKRIEDALRETEKLFRLITENVQDSVWLMDMNLQTTWISPSVEKKRGFTLEELRSIPLERHLTPESLQRAVGLIEKNLFTERLADPREEISVAAEMEFYRKDGSMMWADTIITLLRDAQGIPTGFLGLSRDTTERRRMEEALQESEAKFRTLMETISVGTYLIQDNNFVYVNPAFEDITGYSLNELAGIHFWNFIHPDFREQVREKGIKRLKGEEPPGQYECKIIIKGGQEKWIEISATKFIDLNNKPTIMGSIFNITERKHAEAALMESEEKFRGLAEKSLVGVYLLQDDVFKYVNSKLAEICEYEIEEMIDKIKVSDAVFPEDRLLVEENMRKRISGESVSLHYEFRVYTKNRKTKYVEVYSSFAMYKGKPAIIGTMLDITDRRRAMEELEENRRQLANIIDFLPDAIIVVDKEGKVVAWNRAMETMTGVKKENMLGKGNYEYAIPFYGERRPILIDLALHPDREVEKKYTAIQRVGDILLGESFTFDLPHGDSHLSTTAAVLRDDKGEIISAIECIRDNTERKRLEDRLNRAEKMEALGTLAGGVAHDLNNIIGIMVGYSELILEELPEDSPLKTYADNILQSSTRCAAIIQDLLTLARRGVIVSEVVNLNRSVFDYLRTPEFEKLKSYHPDVKIWTELEDCLLNIKGSPVHLGKTIMNLVSNAAEAISGQGEVTVRTENRYLDRPIQGYDDMQQGDYAILMVSDTGSGISNDNLGKIFEPFYTKKVMGRSGTGLGLAVVWGTVKDHHGYIDVQSKEGKGTTFTLYFPVTRDEPAKAEKAASSGTYMSKGESILVVDDVQEQRDLSKNMLGRLGYRVEVVSSGEMAVDYLKNNKADLIVLDMIMDPGIDGLETYRRILEINPTQKAVIVSGFSETERVREAQEMGAGAFVRKPYILEKIGLAVRRELDRK